MNLQQIRRKVQLGAALLAGAVAFEASGAQVGPSGYVEDSGTALNRHLKELADSPRSLAALLGAAKAALDLGDPQAAVTFYARAEEIAPRDGRIKAGIGAAFLAMEQPEPALKFLDEARGLGLPEGVIAADRGLAHDLLGDPLTAQRDYATAMRANDNDEVRRRLALSRAISGDRGGALAAIEDQVRRNSPAGRRVRAFVLALTGDTSGATDAVRVAMPAQASADAALLRAPAPASSGRARHGRSLRPLSRRCAAGANAGAAAELCRASAQHHPGRAPRSEPAGARGAQACRRPARSAATCCRAGDPDRCGQSRHLTIGSRRAGDPLDCPRQPARSERIGSDHHQHPPHLIAADCSRRAKLGYGAGAARWRKPADGRRRRASIDQPTCCIAASARSRYRFDRAFGSPSSVHTAASGTADAIGAPGRSRECRRCDPRARRGGGAGCG
jgi:tetratricopeptide (TPR) repeat protein